LLAEVAPHRTQFRVQRPDVANDVPVLAGHFRIDRLRDGLRTKCVDVVDLYDMRTEAQLEEGLSLIVLLAGRAQARFGKQAVALGGTGEADAALIALAEREQFVRHSQRGNHERKVVITMSAAWLDASGLDVEGLAEFRREHLAMHRWLPSTRARAVAQQMIHPAVFSPALRHLYLESRALELVTECFTELFATPPENACGISSRVRSRIAALCEWLDSGAADQLDLAAIARHAGLNASSLQQQFKAIQGTSIVAYQRSRRLEAARTALTRDGASVTQAAELSGYTNAANFATAFRRRFGTSPSAAMRAK
jgi:AraC-like DNA-binding protein